MRVLSIDPSIVDLGYACIEEGQVTSYGSVKTKTKDEDTNRYKTIFKELAAVYWKFLPDIIVLESQYLDFGKGAGVLKTTEVMGMVEGMFLAFNFNGTISHVHPKTVKKFLGLPPKTKRAEAKEASLIYVKDHFGIETKNNNISDAILIGFTFLLTYNG